MNNLKKIIENGFSRIIVPGVFNPISCKIAELSGFKAAWLSGFCVSSSLFIPDENYLSIDYYVSKIREIKQVCDIPIIVDCDEGYGTMENTLLLFSHLDELGVEAACIEDNEFPKINSFKESQSRHIVKPEVFTSKIALLKERFPNILLIARTESLIVGETLDSALRRCELYKQAGADLIVIHSKSKTKADFERIIKSCKFHSSLVVIPTMAESLTPQDFFEMGFRIVIYANQLFRQNIFNMHTFYNSLNAETSIMELNQNAVTMDYLFNLIDSNRQNLLKHV